MALSAHKFYGPKGVGVLYVRRGVGLWLLQTGGGQERGRRSGTENIPDIVGLVRALELVQEEREAENVRPAAPRDCLVSGLLARIPGSSLSGHPERRLPGHASLVIRGVEGDQMLIVLDLAGVAACCPGRPVPAARRSPATC